MNLDDFSNKWNELGKTEEGAIKTYLLGVWEHINGNDEGEKMVAMTLPKKSLNKSGLLGTSEKYLLEHYKEDLNIVKSYFGGNPDNNYECNFDNEIVALPQSKKGDKSSRIFIQSGGKDFATPVQLKKNKEGIWKLFNTSSLATGVKKIDDGDF